MLGDGGLGTGQCPYHSELPLAGLGSEGRGRRSERWLSGDAWVPGEGSESRKQKSGHMLAGGGEAGVGGAAASSALPPCSVLSRKCRLRRQSVGSLQ